MFVLANIPKAGAHLHTPNFLVQGFAAVLDLFLRMAGSEKPDIEVKNQECYIHNPIISLLVTRYFRTKTAVPNLMLLPKHFNTLHLKGVPPSVDSSGIYGALVCHSVKGVFSEMTRCLGSIEANTLIISDLSKEPHCLKYSLIVEALDAFDSLDMVSDLLYKGYSEDLVLKIVEAIVLKKLKIGAKLVYITIKRLKFVKSLISLCTIRSSAHITNLILQDINKAGVRDVLNCWVFQQRLDTIEITGPAFDDLSVLDVLARCDQMDVVDTVDARGAINLKDLNAEFLNCVRVNHLYLPPFSFPPSQQHGPLMIAVARLLRFWFAYEKLTRKFDLVDMSLANLISKPCATNVVEAIKATLALRQLIIGMITKPRRVRYYRSIPIAVMDGVLIPAYTTRCSLATLSNLAARVRPSTHKHTLGIVNVAIALARQTISTQSLRLLNGVKVTVEVTAAGIATVSPIVVKNLVNASLIVANGLGTTSIFVTKRVVVPSLVAVKPLATQALFAAIYLIKIPFTIATDTMILSGRILITGGRVVVYVGRPVFKTAVFMVKPPLRLVCTTARLIIPTWVIETAPIRTQREVPPIRIQREVSPIRIQREMPPIRIQREVSPIRIQRDVSPIREVVTALGRATLETLSLPARGLGVLLSLFPIPRPQRQSRTEERSIYA
ncbi:hypothetical protein NEDG_01978 [Nematocida displodere]|uniref:Uncharacterized protein n=1 Tax=Nematocida displodere TaxID=1805483 RepID=A0A177EFE4_9MICR|nr:hypothetical protein NEDG_01978 [Nematocida displodere]